MLLEDVAWQRWIKRWVVLSGRTLRYYSKPGGDEVKATLDLLEIEVDGSLALAVRSPPPPLPPPPLHAPTTAASKSAVGR